MDGSVRREVSASEEEAARGRATDAVIIGNPNSGSAGDEGYLERFAEALRAGGLEVEVLNTERPDHATELSAAAGDDDPVAAGGDGTVNEVVNGLSEGATLGILPLGTANVLARELGLPLKPEDACERILTGTPIRMDVGVATDEEGTERRFTLMAGIGFDADVVREVTPRLKRYLRSLAFPLVALKVYFRGDRPDLQIVVGSGGRLHRIDLGWREHRLGVEFDGLVAHLTREQLARDRDRHNWLTEQDWRLLHFTAVDVFRRADEMVARVARHLDQRGAIMAP
jgi:hypothetical protein